MISSIPAKYLKYIQENPLASSNEIAAHFDNEKAPRTVRHYMQAVEAGIAVPRVSAAFGEWQEGKEDRPFDLDTFIEKSRQEQQQRQDDDPVFVKDTWEFEGDKPVAILFLSCMHLGGRYTNYTEFETVYKTLIENDQIYLASLGDDIEGYLNTFPDRDAVEQQLYSATRQRKAIESVLSPFKGRILCGCGSQHGSKWILKKTGQDPVKEMYLETFNAPFYDGMAYVSIRVGDREYLVALSHEFKGSSAYNPLHAQGRALRENFPSADVVVMGDKHTPAAMWYPAYTIEYDMGLRESPYVALLQAGTLKDGLDKYTIKGWSRGQFGWPFVVFYPNEHKIKWTFDYQDVIKWLSP